MYSRLTYLHLTFAHSKGQGHEHVSIANIEHRRFVKRSDTEIYEIRKKISEASATDWRELKIVQTGRIHVALLSITLISL